MIDTRKSIKSDIEGVSTIGEFIVVQGEIAANNMRRIRDAVVKRRDFIAELSSLYNEVKRNYEKEIKMLLNISKHNKKPASDLLQKNSKTAAVLLSTNTALYGDIVKNTYTLFNDYLKDHAVDPIIIGRMGKQLFIRDHSGADFKYFDYPDKLTESSFLKPIILEIIQYEKAVIFHSKFKTLMTQTPNAFIISEIEDANADHKKDRKYFFEPSLEKVISFFEKEIFGAIFEQTVQESNLSKFASRMVTLDAASENIKRKLGDLIMREKFLSHQLMNKSQLNAMVRVSRWKNTHRSK